MPHHVYANDNEICSKSADGTSILAVDVCFSPGAPMPGVPVPYMNTCKASDIANGSKTVFIKGGEICLEDRSYFSTSYGDEPATQTMKKGTVSGTVQGKCYFIAWSPNVMAEGLAVTRHLDMVTHNHSNPSDTPPVYYLSVASLPKDCKKDKDRMVKRCKPDDDETRRKKGRKRVPAKRKDNSPDGWMTDHCGPLLFKPGDDFKDFLDKFGDIDALIKESLSSLKDDIIAKLEKEIVEYVEKKALAFAARRGLTGWIPFVGWAITAVDLAYTGYELYQKIPEMKEQLSELQEIAGKLEESFKDISKTLEKYKDELKNFDKLPKERQKEVSNEVLAAIQGAYARANPCLKARKCFLVPFKETKNKASTWKGDACCPGQTGHHLLPDVMFRDPNAPREDNRDKTQKMKCWDNYTEGGAPTICLEGGSNSGSHGLVHEGTARLIEPFRSGGTMKYTTARDMLAAQISTLYGCDKDCLIAQLDAYYKDAHTCGDLSTAKVTAHTGKAWGGPPDSYGKRK